MSRFSRFDKLEQERPTSAAPRKAATERFEEAPEGPKPTEPTSPPTGAELSRFDAPPPALASVETDELRGLADLECPTCATRAGRFDRHCASCGASLDSERARTHNLARARAVAAEKPSPGASGETAPSELRAAMEAMVREQSARHRRAELASRAMVVARVLAAITLGLLFAFGRKGQVPWPFACLGLTAFVVLVPAAAWKMRSRHWFD